MAPFFSWDFVVSCHLEGGNLHLLSLFPEGLFNFICPISHFNDKAEN